MPNLAYHNLATYFSVEVMADYWYIAMTKPGHSSTAPGLQFPSCFRAARQRRFYKLPTQLLLTRVVYCRNLLIMMIFNHFQHGSMQSTYSRVKFASRCISPTQHSVANPQHGCRQNRLKAKLGMVLHCRLIQTATLSIPSPQASVMSNLTSNNHTEVQCERVEVLTAVAGIRCNGNCYACKHLGSLLSCLSPFNHWLLSATRKER